MARRRKIEGLGDVVAAVTEFVGIVPCEACLRRKELWNNIFPKRLKPRELTQQELKDWKEYQSNRTLRLNSNQGEWLCKIYADVFQVPLFPFCATCDASPYIRMIERMDKIVETYKT